MGRVGLVGGVVADFVGAGVHGVAEVGDPVVAGASALGIIQGEAAVRATGLGHEKGEVVGGHGAPSYTIYSTSRQVLINTRIHPPACARQRVLWEERRRADAVAVASMVEGGERRDDG